MRNEKAGNGRNFKQDRDNKGSFGRGKSSFGRSGERENAEHKSDRDFSKGGRRTESRGPKREFDKDRDNRGFGEKRGFNKDRDNRGFGEKREFGKNRDGRGFEKKHSFHTDRDFDKRRDFHKDDDFDKKRDFREEEDFEEEQTSFAERSFEKEPEKREFRSYRRSEDRADSLKEDGLTEEDLELPENTLTIEGRNAVLEAFRSGKTIDKLFVLDKCTDGAVSTIRREAKKAGTIMKFVSRERLDQISTTGKHQGVIAYAAAYDYSEIDDIFAKAEAKGEAPFILLLDNIEDPHNLGAIIRSANVAGAHGVIIPKNRAVGLTATVAKTSAGALNYTPVVKVTNISKTIEELKERGVWFVCAAMDGQEMYSMDLTGPIGLVIGNEGAGVSRLVREKCDMVATIPMNGEIESLNASVAAGVLAYEIVRQRKMKKK